jgi:Uma2 family endonuclease
MTLAQGKQEVIREQVYTEAEYLSLERTAEERHEYLDGVIQAMAGESPEHGKISVNLIRIISTHLLGKNCDLFTKDTKVRSGPLPRSRTQTKGLFSYPDLVVVCGVAKYLDDYRDVLTNPVVIVEVLSDSTEKFDYRQKFLRYQQYLPSLVDYVLVSQEEPAIEIYHRPSPRSSRWEYTATSELKSRIAIPSLKCTLRLAEVYYRVSFSVAAEQQSIKPVKTRAPQRHQTASTAAGKKQSPAGRKKIR